MILLTLDTSIKRTGFAVGPVNGEPVLGSFSLPSFRNNQIGRYLAAHEDWLISLLVDNSVDDVGIEAPVLPKGKMANITVRRKLWGLIDCTDKVCSQRDLACFEVGNKSIKLFITGNGNAQKIDVIDAVRRLGLNPQNDDEADAAALWIYSLAWLDRRDGTANQQDWLMKRG